MPIHQHAQMNVHAHVRLRVCVRGGTVLGGWVGVCVLCANDWKNRERVLDLFSNFEWVKSKGFFQWTCGAKWELFVGFSWWAEVTVTPPPFSLVSSSPPCVRPKKPPVWQHMCAWCRYTPGRFESTHGGFLCVPHTTTTRRHRDTETETDRNRERDRERRWKQREREREKERWDKIRKGKRRRDKRKEKSSRRQQL